MAWARIDDGFHDHPKVDELSLAAVGLWTLCLTWAHRHRKTAVLPGHVTPARVRKLAGKQGDGLAAELVAARLWDVEPNIGGWEIHDFADYLPRERDPEERREAGRRGAANRWQSNGKKDGKPDGNLPSVLMASDSSRASAPASPSRPDPSKGQKTPSTDVDADPKPPKLTKDTDPRFVEFWTTYPKRVAKAEALKALAKVLAAGVPIEDVVKGAARYRDDPKRDPEFTAHPATWLNAGRWTDETSTPQRHINPFNALSRGVRP